MKSYTDYYNKLWSEEYLPPYVTSLFALFETMNLSPKSKVLDIACGNGALGKYLIKKFNCRMWGTDISEVALKQAREEGYITELADLDNEALPFPEEKFDLVVLSAMLEHVLDPEAVIKTGFEKLVPNGYIIVLTPNVVWCFNRLLFLMGRWDHRLMGGMKGHISYRNKKQLKQMLTETGFVNLDWNFSVFCVAGRSEFCTKGLTGWLIKKVHNLRVKFWHSLFAFNFIVVAQKRTNKY